MFPAGNTLDESLPQYTQSSVDIITSRQVQSINQSVLSYYQNAFIQRHVANKSEIAVQASYLSLPL